MLNSYAKWPEGQRVYIVWSWKMGSRVRTDGRFFRDICTGIKYPFIAPGYPKTSENMVVFPKNCGWVRLKTLRFFPGVNWQVKSLANHWPWTVGIEDDSRYSSDVMPSESWKPPRDFTGNGRYSRINYLLSIQSWRFAMGFSRAFSSLAEGSIFPRTEPKKGYWWNLTRWT